MILSVLPPLRFLARYLVVALICFTGTAHAQDQALPAKPPAARTFEVKLSETGSWDSNPLMLAHGAEALLGSTTELQLMLNRLTPISHLKLEAIVDQNVYDHSEFNSTDFHGNAQLGRQMERWGASIDGKVDYDTTRTSELTNYGLNLPSVRHTGLMVSPRLTFKATPVDEFTLAGSAADSSYDDDAFIDYQLYSVTPTYAHHFDPLNTGIFSIRVQRYETDMSQVDSIGPSIGWIAVLTPKLTLKTSVGFESVSSDPAAANPDDSDLNYTFSGDLTYRDQQDTIDLILLRALQPFGNGTQTLLTSITLRGTHNVNEKLSVNAMGSYKFAEYDVTPGVNLKNDLQLGAGLGYRIYRDLDLTANYRYRVENLTNIEDSITDNAILLGLSLHLLPKAW